MNNLSLVNIFGETGRFFYNINYMLNSEHFSLVNKIGDKTEFTITRVHCIKNSNGLVTSFVVSLLIFEVPFQRIPILNYPHAIQSTFFFGQFDLMYVKYVPKRDRI